MAFGEQLVSIILSSVIRALLVLDGIFRRLGGLPAGDTATRGLDDNQSSHPTTAEVNKASRTNDSIVAGNLGAETSADDNNNDLCPTTIAASSVLDHSEAEAGQPQGGTLEKSLGGLRDFPRQGTALLLHREHPGLVTEKYRVVLLDIKLVSLDSRSTIAAGEPNSSSCRVHRLTIQDTHRASPRPPKAKGARALSIGINGRQLGPEKALKYAGADAKRFTGCLIKYLGFKEEEVHTLTDEESETIRRGEILPELNWLFKGPQEGATRKSNDMLVLFISGHCQLNEENKIVSLLSMEGDPNQRIASPRLGSYLEELPSGCTVEVVLDCCHGAGLIRLPEIQKMELDNGASPTNQSAASAASEPIGETSTMPPRPPARGGARGGICHSITQLMCVGRRQEKPEEIQMGLSANSPRTNPTTEASRTVLSETSASDEPSTRPQPHAPSPLHNSLTGKEAGGAMCNTKANVTVWAAVGLGQEAYEPSGAAGGLTNGVLTHVS
ncbi:hypothetical protein FRC08_016891 [Ceratobasidium sp. 394]|nr:hypothetical protein FRC08_016891 [Ceratobasidium sp. 394]KAG9094462.1 hypothetical protein FS749_012441 [Ceratobasidium sp. UAMH 11750]